MENFSSGLDSTILAVIPAYNEGKHIKAVIDKALGFLPVLVVDDGSSDLTAKLSEDSGAIVFRQGKNQGKGAALRAGFRWAMDHGYDAVVTLDADGQHDPLEIPGFINAFNVQKKDLIIGAREFLNMPLIRKIGNSLGRAAFSWAVGQPIKDNQSGYRLISRRLMGASLDSDEQGFEFEVEIIVTCIHNGWSIDWVPIKTIYADEKSHIKPIRHVLNFLRVIRSARKKLHG